MGLVAPGAAVSGMIANIGTVAQVILVILLLLSLFSWTIIYDKWRSLRQLRRKTRAFLRALYKAGRLSELHAASENFLPSPAVSVFEAGYDELERQLRPGGSRSVASVERALKAETGDQVALMETKMSWLGTIASASPFIGLFGTVWGIMDAFYDLGTAGTATLRAVAPGVAEALITTAAGLFAAIPALIAYNQFVHRIRELSTSTEECALEVTTRAQDVIAAADNDHATVGGTVGGR
ncbi:MAG: MotA/TolQ/ExbB proton channel family protein [Terriglobales bacterium]